MVGKCAVIGPGASIGPGAKIGPCANVTGGQTVPEASFIAGTATAATCTCEALLGLLQSGSVVVPEAGSGTKDTPLHYPSYLMRNVLPLYFCVCCKPFSQGGGCGGCGFGCHVGYTNQYGPHGGHQRRPRSTVLCSSSLLSSEKGFCGDRWNGMTMTIIIYIYIYSSPHYKS